MQLRPRQQMEFMVQSNDELRLSRFVATRTKTLSIRQAAALCRGGSVQVNGTARPPGFSLTPGDIVILVMPSSDPRLSSLESEIEVVHEDEWLLCVHKPRLLHSVSLQMKSGDSLAARLLKNYPELSFDPLEAGLAQRLDFETEGLVLVGRSEEILAKLRAALLGGEIRKTYVALVEGDVSAPMTIESYLSQSGAKVRSSEVEREGDVFCRTFVRPLKTFSTKEGQVFSVIEANVPRARRHQVRVHLASRGHSLVGDSVYGSQTKLEDFRAEFGDPDGTKEKDIGFFLLANSLEFAHPETGERLSFSTESLYAQQLFNCQEETEVPKTAESS